jgi:hypothetical protein
MKRTLFICRLFKDYCGSPSSPLPLGKSAIVNPGIPNSASSQFRKKFFNIDEDFLFLRIWECSSGRILDGSLTGEKGLDSLLIIDKVEEVSSIYSTAKGER